MEFERNFLNYLSDNYLEMMVQYNYSKRTVLVKKKFGKKWEQKFGKKIGKKIFRKNINNQHS